MKRSALVGSVLVLMFIGFNVSPVAGQSESQTWGGTNFDFQKAGFATCDGPCFIWKNGDFWSQTFFSSALSSVGRLDLTLNITNVLNSGSSIFFAALVNGAQAGTFSFADGDPNGPYNFGWDLSPVSASDYEVKLAILSPDVP